MDGSEPISRDEVGTGRDEKGRFMPGSGGRPLGARNRASRRAALAILADFTANQDEILARSRRWFLPQYLTTVRAVLPRPVDAPGLDLAELAPSNAAAVVAAVRAAADRYEAGL